MYVLDSRGLPFPHHEQTPSLRTAQFLTFLKITKCFSFCCCNFRSVCLREMFKVESFCKMAFKCSASICSAWYNVINSWAKKKSSILFENMALWISVLLDFYDEGIDECALAVPSSIIDYILERFISRLSLQLAIKLIWLVRYISLWIGGWSSTNWFLDSNIPRFHNLRKPVDVYIMLMFKPTFWAFRGFADAMESSLDIRESIFIFNQVKLWHSYV